MPNEEVMTTGFLLAGLAWTLWWNLDWRRFIKFYGVNNPSYHPWAARGLRVFFALCSLGAAGDLGHRLLQIPRPVQFYWDSFVVAAVWFVAIILLVKTVEWMNSKRKRRVTIPQ
jgi:hypothetical protein